MKKFLVLWLLITITLEATTLTLYFIWPSLAAIAVEDVLVLMGIAALAGFSWHMWRNVRDAYRKL